MGESVTTETTTFTVQHQDQGPFEVSRPVGCHTEPGTPIDLDSEPAFWLAFGEYLRWTDTDGCTVRIDVISHNHLAEHCGWEAAESITIGQTLGEPFGDSLGWLGFLWNGEGVVPGADPGEIISVAALPESARDAGYRQGPSELWVDDDDPSVLYVVADDVKIFRLEPAAGICA